MFQSPQADFQIAASCRAATRVIWIGSKVAESVGIDIERQSDVYSHMWRRVLERDCTSALPANEADQLAAKLVALATIAERMAATAVPQAALAAVMRESGQAIDPLLAKNFLRLAGSPVFWLALQSVDED